jgi:hypothetical protein
VGRATGVGGTVGRLGGARVVYMRDMYVCVCIYIERNMGVR